MTTGDTTDATDEAVQANIVAVGYKNIPGCKVLDMPFTRNPLI